MNSLRLFRGLAYFNLVAGIFMASSVVIVGVGFLATNPGKTNGILGIGLALITLLGCISFVVLKTVRTYFKCPDLVSALGLARNSAVILWFVFFRLFEKTAVKEFSDPLFSLVALLVSYSAYRFLLKPAALAVFPATADLSSNETL